MIGVVYVVSAGEHGEGHTAEAARASVQAAKRYCVRKYGVVPTSRGKGEWMANRVGSHVDEVWIQRLSLREDRGMR